MADKTLKASIQVDMDAKGVAKGVAATNRELDKLNRTARQTSVSTGIMAGISAIQVAYGALSGFINGLTEHVNKLDQLGRRFSVEGMNADIRAQVAQMESDAKIGKAMGPASAAIAQQEEKAAIERANRITSNADIGAGSAATKTFFKTLGDGFVAGWDQFTANMSDPLALNQPSVIGAFADAVGATGFYTGGMTGADLAGGVGPARGMDPAMERNNRILDSIERKIGGN